MGVDVLVNNLQDKIRAKFVVIGLSGGAIFTAIVGTLGFKFVWQVGMRYAVATVFGFNWPDLTSGPVSPDLEWPVWIFYSAIPLGSYLMCFRFLQVINMFIRTGKLPQVDTSHVEGLSEEFDFDDEDSLGSAGVQGGKS